jgi:RNA polymerase sigma-70 factor (ECF subfamily)
MPSPGTKLRLVPPPDFSSGGPARLRGHASPAAETEEPRSSGIELVSPRLVEVDASEPRAHARRARPAARFHEPPELVPEDPEHFRSQPSPTHTREIPIPLEPAVAPAGEPSLEVLYQEYAPYVAGVASRVLGRAAEVDDVVQEVFALAVRGLRRREEPNQMKGWFAKVTVRLCTRQLRSRRLWALVDLAADANYDRLAEPDAGADEKQLVIEVYRALDRLPTRERVPWTLRHVEGEQLERVAELCGCSLATVKRRVARAHEKLHTYLKEKSP